MTEWLTGSLESQQITDGVPRAGGEGEGVYHNTWWKEIERVTLPSLLTHTFWCSYAYPEDRDHPCHCCWWQCHTCSDISASTSLFPKVSLQLFKDNCYVFSLNLLFSRPKSPGLNQFHGVLGLETFSWWFFQAQLRLVSVRRSSVLETRHGTPVGISRISTAELSPPFGFSF